MELSEEETRLAFAALEQDIRFVSHLALVEVLLAESALYLGRLSHLRIQGERTVAEVEAQTLCLEISRGQTLAVALLEEAEVASASRVIPYESSLLHSGRSSP